MKTPNVCSVASLVSPHRTDAAQAFGYYTQLYPLVPMGRDSALSESVPSYLHRLAVAHGGLSALGLYAQVILPVVGNRGPQNATPIQGRRVSTLLYPTSTSRIAVKVLAGLTGQGDLSFLIAEKLSRLTRIARVMRPTWAWCPLCMDQWRANGLPLYFPLLWNVTAYSICVTHSVRLLSACPNCGFKAFLFATKNWSVFCRRCGHYQIGEAVLPHVPDSIDRSSWEWNSSFRAYECFASLAGGRDIKNVCFVKNLKRGIESAGSENALAGPWAWTIIRFISGLGRLSPILSRFFA